MRLNHTGLNIQSEEEVIDFYQNILGFHFEYQFDLPAESAKDIFGLNKRVKAFLCKRDDLRLELFVHDVHPDKGFSHICFEVKDRENIAVQCKDKGYQVIRIERTDRPDILFVKDKSENIFELKDK